MTKERQHKERTGEEIACDFLKERGYSIVERDYRSRIGEIDIVAKHREYLVFCGKYAQKQNRTSPVFVSNCKKLRN